MPRLNRILVLRNFDFPLEDIGQMLEKELSLEEMRLLLLQKQRMIEAQLQAEADHLRCVSPTSQCIEHCGFRRHCSSYRQTPAATMAFSSSILFPAAATHFPRQIAQNQAFRRDGSLNLAKIRRNCFVFVTQLNQIIYRQ
ncbi:MAG: hypothetical protein KDE58_05310 [Caldilineaceae bacterium]|nr:hypothetical protein [Caldilineaceae bacterium]